MISAILSVALIAIALGIYRSKDTTASFLLYATGMCLMHPSFRLYEFGAFYSHLFLTLIMLAKLYKSGNIKKCWSVFPLKRLTVGIFFVYLLQVFIVDWMPAFKIIMASVRDFSLSYLCVFIGFCCFQDEQSLYNRTKSINIFAIIFALIGIVSYINQSNFISEAIEGDELMWSADNALSERGFRATGTQHSPNIMGLISGIYILIINHMEKNKYIKHIIILLLLVNIICCATRAPFVTLILMLLVYYLCFSMKKIVIALAGGLILVITANMFLADNEILQSYIGGVADIFLTGGENTGGSDMDLRMRQLMTTLGYFSQNPIFGHGNGFVSDLVSESGLFSMLKIDDLAGAEGYLFFLLIDFGISLTFLVLLFLVKLFKIFIHNRRYPLSALGLSILAGGTFFILSSRPDNSFECFFPWVGLVLGYITNCKYGANQIDK